jgi:hypothetical protein
MNQNATDHDDLPTEIDFTGAERGKFYQANTTLNFPADSETQAQPTQQMR